MSITRDAKPGDRFRCDNGLNTPEVVVAKVFEDTVVVFDPNDPAAVPSGDKPFPLFKASLANPMMGDYEYAGPYQGWIPIDIDEASL